MVCNIELRPGDGGKIARSSGAFATVIAHAAGKTTVRLPSKRTVRINSNSRATLGIISGGGRREKPFMTAGEKISQETRKGTQIPHSTRRKDACGHAPPRWRPPQETR